MDNTPVDNKPKVVWLDGEFVPWAQAQIHVMTNTMHYGTGVFEGIRCYATAQGPAIFRFPEHLKRLRNSGKVVGFSAPFDDDTLTDATKQLIIRNNLEECYIRPLVFIGDDSFGVNWLGNPIRVALVVFPWGAYLGEDGIKNGVRVKVSSFTRHHVNINMTKAKVVGNYVNSQLAKLDAVKDGYHEALMSDVDGYVVEGSGENIFIVEDGHLVTPPPGSILPGITRSTIMDLAREEGLKIREDRLTRDRIYTADEMFFTGTAAEVTPIREVDRREIGEGGAGPITKKLQKRYFDLVKGRDEKHLEWLDFVTVSGLTSATSTSRSPSAARSCS